MPKFPQMGEPSPVFIWRGKLPFFVTTPKIKPKNCAIPTNLRNIPLNLGQIDSHHKPQPSQETISIFLRTGIIFVSSFDRCHSRTSCPEMNGDASRHCKNPEWQTELRIAGTAHLRLCVEGRGAWGRELAKTRLSSAAVTRWTARDAAAKEWARRKERCQNQAVSASPSGDAAWFV